MSEAMAVTPTTPVPRPSIPLWKRMLLYAQMTIAKKVILFIYNVGNFFSPPPVSWRPTFVRRYPVRPKLSHRVFIPPTYGPDSKLLPLYLDIHGGGFAICNPSFDDEFCSALCKRNNIIVVSLDYSKSPQAVFPTAIYDIEATAQAVIADTSLPIDKSRVVIGGFSAGGCLSLAASQTLGLKDKIKGLVAWYPGTDFTSTLEMKLAARAYAFPGQKDNLVPIFPGIEYGYIRQMGAEERKNPLLSPVYAPRACLPEWIYIISAEWDCLAPEARELAERLYGQEIPKTCYQVETGDKRLVWEEVRSVEHGFTHMKEKKKESEELRLEAVNLCYAKVDEWLMEEVLKK